MNVSMDVAATITAAGIAIVNVGTLALQIMQARRSISNGRKIDENTALTKDTAAKVDAVHGEVVAATGTHQILTHDGG